MELVPIAVISSSGWDFFNWTITACPHAFGHFYLHELNDNDGVIDEHTQRNNQCAQGYLMQIDAPVSYTHLDVYKRQPVYCVSRKLYRKFRIILKLWVR